MNMFPKDHDIMLGKNLWRFLSRLGIAACVFVICIAIATSVAMRLDGLDFVTRMLAAFSPYAKSLPWILCIVSLTLILCLPGGPTELLGILKKIRKIGPLEFFPSLPPEYSHPELFLFDDELVSNGTCRKQKPAPIHSEGDKTTGLATNTSGASPGMVRAVTSMLTMENQQALLNKLQAKKSQTTYLLQHHAGRIGATITDRNIRLRQHALHFDACMKRDDEQFLVRVASADSLILNDIVSDFGDIAESLAKSIAEQVSFHLLVTIRTKLGETGALTPQGVAEKTKTIRHSFPTGNTFRLYFYSVSEDFAVKPLEETP